MELIDRYLQSVKWMLPRKQQDDVIRELSDEILSQVEEKENALGRPLTEDEQVALLRQLGHPMLLASRYNKQRYLIDPAIFAIYWLVLRILLAVTFFGMAVGAVTIAATGQGFGRALTVLVQFPFTALTVFAWVTLVFVIFDIVQVKFNFYAKWDPRTLPKVTKRRPKHSMAESIGGLIAGVIFGVWWLVGLKHQFWIFGPGVAFMHFGPVWQTLYPLFVVLVIADAVRHTVEIVRPEWEIGRVAFRLFFRAMNLILLGFLLNANELIVPTDASNAQLRTVFNGINHVSHLCLIVAAVMTVAQIAWDTYSYYFRGPGNGACAVVN